MTVLCTDKTGTLTSAEITLARSLDAAGADDPRAARLGAIAADTRRRSRRARRGAGRRLGRMPRRAGRWPAGTPSTSHRRLGSVLATGPEGALLIVKGAPEAVLALLHVACGRQRRAADGRGDADAGDRRGCTRWPSEGLRAIAIASRPWTGATHEVEAADETDLVFEGLCAFADPPKPTAAAAIARLAAAGIRLKILSGDDPVVVKRLAGLVGLNADTRPVGQPTSPS